MAGIKLNLRDSVLIREKNSYIMKMKGRDNSGVDFSWQSPVSFVVDTSFTTLLIVTVFSSAASATVKVDWGDGTSNTYTGSTLYSRSKTYSPSTTRKVKITSSLPFFVQANTNNVVEVLSLYGNGTPQISTFGGDNLSKMPSFLPPSLTDLSSAFAGNAFNGAEVEGWDTSNVTDIEFLVNNNGTFNRDISSWDTSKVTTMRSAFSGADSFNQNISSWDVSSVTDMSFMFQFNDAFNQNISSWDTSKVTTMREMFFAASAFNQDLGNLPINNVTNMTQMLGAYSSGSGLSTENYSRTLIGWANQHFAGNAKNNVPLGADFKTYNNTPYTTGNQFNDAVSARAYLISVAGWTIVDGGQV